MAEQELIAGCIAGDRKVQQRLYQQYSKRMYTLA